jgi:hypothetical protein
MSFLSTLEQKFGRFAIPNLITALAGLQAVNWLLIKAVPGFMEKLAFIPDEIWDGEVWRLVSYILLPGSTSILWLLFIGFIFMLNDGLEEAWGSFRVNLFMLASVVSISAGGLMFDFVSTGAVLWAGVLLAFALYFPNQEVMLYFILPIKIKWIAWITAAGLIFAFIGDETRRPEIIFSLLPFFAVFLPGWLRDLRHGARVAERRQRYDSAQLSDEESLHRCIKCGSTEKQNPQLDFRVNADGEDVCHECRAAKTDA